LADEEFPREDELESRQGAALYPVGRVLRTTYDAENHDSLGNDLTGLMLELAHIDPHAEPMHRQAVPVVPPSQPAIAAPAPPMIAPVLDSHGAVSWWRIALGRLLAR
jgi:hypothetical protein